MAKLHLFFVNNKCFAFFIEIIYGSSDKCVGVMQKESD